MNQIEKRTLELTFAGKLIVSLVVLLAINIASSLYNNALQRSIKRELEVVQKDVDAIKELNIEMKGQLNILQEQKAIDLFNGLDFVDGPNDSREVIFTNYWNGDGSSSNVTASGLKTSDFTLNSKGWWTFQGKVVLATANSNRLNRALKNGYKSHDLYDEISFDLDGKTYQGVVLDVCGACYGVESETNQRYDIFTNSNVVGKKYGSVIYEKGE